MLVKTITDNESGRKWEISKIDDDTYSVAFFEFYKSTGWRRVSSPELYSKDAVEWEFDIEVA